MKNFLQQIWWGNTVQQYALVLGEIILTWVVLRLIRKFIFSKIKKVTSRTPSEVDDAMVSAAEKFIIPYLYFGINYAIINQLELTKHVEHILNVAFAVITAYYFVRFINHVIHLSVLMYMERKHESAERISHLSGILIMVKVMVWIGGALMLVENLGYNITTIITGLGIGGIAIALAAQNILSDLFSYFVIFFDKPFEIGDNISMNNASGTVEKIGIKTSHIRSVSGELLVVPNAELVKSIIKNFKRLERRGVIFKLNVRYDTAEEKLRLLPQLIETIVHKQQYTKFDRCHLVAFDNFCLTYEILYYIDTPDYKTYLDIQQNIYLEVLDAFIKQGIDFAFPGQTFILQHPHNNDKK